MYSSTTSHLPSANVKRQEDTPAYLWYRKHNSPKNIVAPMVNQSELAFRLLCLRYGADLAYTPMFHSKLFVSHENYRREQFEHCLGDEPLVIQLCGNDPTIVLQAAQACVKKERDDWEVNYLANKRRYGFVGQGRVVRLKDQHHIDHDLPQDHPYFHQFQSSIYSFDINYGCPQLCAKRGYYGAFLMDDQKLVRDILSTMHRSENLPIPVTAKIRIYDDVQHTLAYAEMIRDAGAQWICVHGRTRDQKGRNTGLADWEVIRMIRERITDIPIIANGNIRCTQDVDECIRVTGCDGVMTANGILENPAIFETPQWVDPYTLIDRVDPNNPNLFVPRRELLLAKEYLDIVDTIQPTIRHPTIRSHLFKMCKPELDRNIDLRSLLSDCSMTLSNFHFIVDEVIHRSRYGLHSGTTLDHFFEDDRWNLNRTDFENIPTNRHEFKALYKKTTEEIEENDSRSIVFHHEPHREAKRAELRDILGEDQTNPDKHTENYYTALGPTIRQFMQLHVFQEQRKKMKTEIQDNNDSVDVLEETDLTSFFDL